MQQVIGSTPGSRLSDPLDPLAAGSGASGWSKSAASWPAIFAGAFVAIAASIVLLRGDVGHKNFWLVDLGTGAERQITELVPDIAISDFDLSRDGSAVLFDRIQESSRIALIERGR